MSTINHPSTELPEDMREEVSKEAMKVYPENKLIVQGKLFSDRNEKYRNIWKAGATAYAPCKVLYEQAIKDVQEVIGVLKEALLPSNKTIIGTIPSFMVKKLEDALSKYLTTINNKQYE